MSPDERAAIVPILKRTQLFGALEGTELSSLANRTAMRRYAPGEVLFFEGEPCVGLYIVLSGRIRIFKTSHGGREYVLAIEGSGASIAELPVFDGGNYPASAAAVESTELIFISRNDFRAFCLEHPEVALKVLQVVGARLRRLVGIIEELSFSSLRQRLVSWLLRQAKAQGRETGRGLTFQLGVTHQELAAHIGTVRELVSRNMSRLQAEGLIEVSGREVIIPDTEALEAELSAGV